MTKNQYIINNCACTATGDCSQTLIGHIILWHGELTSMGDAGIYYTPSETQKKSRWRLLPVDWCLITHCCSRYSRDVVLVIAMSVQYVTGRTDLMSREDRYSHILRDSFDAWRHQRRRMGRLHVHILTCGQQSVQLLTPTADVHTQKLPFLPPVFIGQSNPRLLRGWRAASHPVKIILMSSFVGVCSKTGLPGKRGFVTKADDKSSFPLRPSYSNVWWYT